MEPACGGRIGSGAEVWGEKQKTRISNYPVEKSAGKHLKEWKRLEQLAYLSLFELFSLNRLLDRLEETHCVFLDRSQLRKKTGESGVNNKNN